MLESLPRRLSTDLFSHKEFLVQSSNRLLKKEILTNWPPRGRQNSILYILFQAMFPSTTYLLQISCSSLQKTQCMLFPAVHLIKGYVGVNQHYHSNDIFKFFTVEIFRGMGHHWYFMFVSCLSLRVVDMVKHPIVFFNILSYWIHKFCI